MFERFTERARQVVVLAQDEARNLKHDYIGTEHVLLGLLREEEGIAARVLGSLDVRLEEVRERVAQVVGQGDEVTTGQIPFTPRAKKVLELALREALSLGHDYIGTEHILLGLARENDGVAARILDDLDADAEKIRNEVIDMLSGPRRRERALRRARAEAAAAGHGEVEPEDLLLGVLAQLQRGAELDLDAIRSRLGRPEPASLPEPAPDIPFSEAAALAAAGRSPAAILRALAAGGVGGLDPAAVDRALAARRARRGPLPPWEHHVVDLGDDPAEWRERLDEAGADGWELVALAGGRAIFKRRRLG